MATNVAVIGAGPAGLAASVCLAEQGVPHTVYERGAVPLAALRTLDPAMHLLTPAALSRLPGMSLRDSPTYLRFDAFIRKIEQWQSERHIEVVTGVEIDRVSHPDKFVLSYRRNEERGEVTATHIVNATGIIAHPKLPAGFDPQSAQFKWCHSVAVRAPDLASARRLLVIGAGTSGAEVLERWLEVRQPGNEAWISVRGPVLAAPSSVLGIDIHYFGWLLEQMPGRFAGYRFGPRRDLIIGRRIIPALRRREIRRVAAVARYEPQGVIFTDSTRIEPDLVVFATGFKYDTPHLGELVARDPDGWPILSGAESTRAPGLYLLGVRFGRTIASPYLRGIARDARYVARRIARRR